MTDVKRVAHQAHQSDSLDVLVRIGLVAYGVVHLMVGWLALQVAFGEKSEQASGSGAMHALADQPFGAVLVWGVAIGMALLVGWRVLEAWQAFHTEDGADRARRMVSQLGKGVLYGVLAVSATKTALGDSTQGSGTDSFTSQLMAMPGGQLIVGAIGLAVLGYGGWYVYQGWSERYLEKLDGQGRGGQNGTAFKTLGKVGYVAKGGAIGVVGGLFVYAALTHDAQKSGGLDQALQEIADQPFGQGLLTLVALDIGCYGLFAFARARHLSR